MLRRIDPQHRSLGQFSQDEIAAPLGLDFCICLPESISNSRRAAPAIPPSRSFYDECMMGDGVQFSLGFMKHCPVWPFGQEGSFGAPGTGGSLGFGDPRASIGYAYVTSRMGTSVTGDPRDIALRDALYSTGGRAAGPC